MVTGGPHPLFPELPFTMAPRIRAAVADRRLQEFVNGATELKDRSRREACARAFGDRYDELRRRAGAVKQHTLDHLDHYLERWIDAAQAAGIRVHFAADGDEANGIVVGLARGRGCRSCVKSKSMVTEETRLLPALQAVGIDTVETDLGEYVLQLDGDAPSHIVTPMIHRDRKAAADAFVRELHEPYTEDPEELTAIARRHLRARYRAADLGVTGGNFLLADTGSLVLCTNEGNAGFVTSGPRVHVALVGIEKVLPSASSLPLFLKLLARSATGQPLTVYTTAIGGPRRRGDADGPEEVHVVLVDNGRSRLLAPESRELLRCIRCGACLNTCPVYRKVGGGHGYGAVYSGPIGAVLTPGLLGLASYPDLPRASSLCGACHSACPVDIDIPRHLVRLRRDAFTTRVLDGRQRLGLRLWAWCLRGRVRYAVAGALQRGLLRWAGRRAPGRGAGTVDRRWLRHGPGPLRGWTAERDFPTPTRTGFRSWWRQHRRSP